MSNKISHSDVIIIGGGPAGLSAAIWCIDLGLRPRVFEKETECGGQLLWTYNPIVNYPGKRAENGVLFRDSIFESFPGLDENIFVSTPIASIDHESCSVTTESDEIYTADALILATGVRRRRLNIPGESEFVGRGVLTSGVLQQRETVGRRTSVIVGGGDSAVENAIILGKLAKEVVVVHRRKSFTARDEFITVARRMGNVRFVTNAIITAIEGDAEVGSVTVMSDEVKQKIETDHVLVRIGSLPNTELLSGQALKDEKGYLIVDAECRTSLENIYCIGDASSQLVQTISKAAGDASVAVRCILRDREHPGSNRQPEMPDNASHNIER